MTPGYLTYAAFAAICLLFLLLPFIPAYMEWQRPTDMEALRVSANYTSDIDHFAKRLFADAQAHLGRGPATGFQEFDTVGQPAGAMDWRNAGKRLIARSSIDVDEPIHSSQQLFVDGTLAAGTESSFSAVYAAGDIRLGAESQVRDWIHADGMLQMGQRSAALRRASAGAFIHLGEETWFERLHAPVILFGAPGTGSRDMPDVAPAEASYGDLPNAVQQTPLLFVIRGDCVLPPDRHYRGSLVVTGFLSIGARTIVEGDVKARKGLSVGDQASVLGAVTCEKRIYFFSQSRALGPVISESDILVGAGCVMGRPDAQTTVSAANIIVEDGATVHGSVWAHDIGMVKPAR